MAGGTTNFYSQRVRKHVGSNSRRALTRAGAYLRRVARNSIRKRKSVSRPGNPPSSHSGELKRFIYFANDGNWRVVVGPEILPGKVGKAPSVLERGGKINLAKNPRRRELKIGMSGAISIGRNGQRGYKIVRGMDNKRYYAAFAVIKNESMLRRAKSVESEIWGAMYLHRRSIAARPFMVPALRATIEKLPFFWSYGEG